MVWKLFKTYFSVGHHCSLLQLFVEPQPAIRQRAPAPCATRHACSMRVGAVLIHDVTRGKCAWFPEIRRIDDDDNVGRVWVSIEECESHPCHCVPVVWRVACGVWRVACGVWRVACGVWRVACGVWRVTLGVRFAGSKAMILYHTSHVTPPAVPCERGCCPRPEVQHQRVEQRGYQGTAAVQRVRPMRSLLSLRVCTV